LSTSLVYHKIAFGQNLSCGQVKLKNKKARLRRAKPLLARPIPPWAEMRRANKKFLNSPFQKSHIVARGAGRLSNS